jgi:hypothetical protein
VPQPNNGCQWRAASPPLAKPPQLQHGVGLTRRVSGGRSGHKPLVQVADPAALAAQTNGRTSVAAAGAAATASAGFEDEWDVMPWSRAAAAAAERGLACAANAAPGLPGFQSATACLPSAELQLQHNAVPGAPWAATHAPATVHSHAPLGPTIAAPKRPFSSIAPPHGAEMCTSQPASSWDAAAVPAPPPCAQQGKASTLNAGAMQWSRAVSGGGGGVCDASQGGHGDRPHHQHTAGPPHSNTTAPAGTPLSTLFHDMDAGAGNSNSGWCQRGCDSQSRYSLHSQSQLGDTQGVDDGADGEDDEMWEQAALAAMDTTHTARDTAAVAVAVDVMQQPASGVSALGGRSDRAIQLPGRQNAPPACVTNAVWTTDHSKRLIAPTPPSLQNNMHPEAASQGGWGGGSVSVWRAAGLTFPPSSTPATLTPPLVTLPKSRGGMQPSAANEQAEPDPRHAHSKEWKGLQPLPLPALPMQQQQELPDGAVVHQSANRSHVVSQDTLPVVPYVLAGQPVGPTPVCEWEAGAATVSVGVAPPCADIAPTTGVCY